MADNSEATDPAYYTISTDCTAEELLAVVRAYARSVVNAHDLDVDVNALGWEVSRRAKRRAGAMRHTDGEPQSVSITWAFFQRRGWLETAAIVRHELAHAHLVATARDAGHGTRFRALAEELDAPVTCERFVEPAWWVTCRDCGSRAGRYRRSSLVEEPERYRCGECGGRLWVEPSG